MHTLSLLLVLLRSFTKGGCGELVVKGVVKNGVQDLIVLAQPVLAPIEDMVHYRISIYILTVYCFSFIGRVK